MAQDGQDCFHCIYVCQQSKDGRVANESIFLKEVWEEWRHDNRHCIGDGSIQKNSCLLNKLLTRIAVTRAGENKMAQNIDAKPLHKTTVSWFDFLFDTTGDLLKKHLDNASAGSYNI